MNAHTPLPSSQKAWTRALEESGRATRDATRTLPFAALEWAELYQDRQALIGEDESYTFAGLAARLNQYARWGLSQKLHKGATVALAMSNRPEYFAIWLGLTRIGVVVALIPPELGDDALTHALAVSEAVGVIATPPAADALRRIGFSGPVWRAEDGEGSLEAQIALFSPAGLDRRDAPEVTLDDRALRIFTSGTTGLPKAAEVSHRKAILWTHWFAALAGLGPEDRLYNALPMHHSVGGVVAVGAPLVHGGAVVIARKFSARKFWDDIARYDCTAFQYIGELCRYLNAAPPPRRETRLRLALGNGLAAPVWRKFAARFPDVRVLEFYASTEGNVWLYNVEGRVGALGRLPPYLAVKAPIALVRFDEEAQAPARGADGRCVACAENEPGEALGRIGADAASRFEGYSDAGETQKKIVRDVFAAGDAYMRTGDLMRRDGEGFYWFVDRIGDTFRWKGENVACAEVEAALRRAPGVRDALVYGVKVPGAEGRAGMAVLAADATLDLEALALVVEALPRWARPVFLRVAGTIARTETFKPKRALYVADGLNPRTCDEPFFVWEDGEYVPLDDGRLAEIEAGRTRL